MNWRTSPGADAWRIIDAREHVVARVFHHPEWNTETVSRQMAAGPELLAALKVAVDALRSWESMGLPPDLANQSWNLYQNSPEMKTITAAIAKAERRS